MDTLLIILNEYFVMKFKKTSMQI